MKHSNKKSSPPLIVELVQTAKGYRFYNAIEGKKDSRSDANLIQGDQASISRKLLKKQKKQHQSDNQSQKNKNLYQVDDGMNKHLGSNTQVLPLTNFSLQQKQMENIQETQKLQDSLNSLQKDKQTLQEQLTKVGDITGQKNTNDLETQQIKQSVDAIQEQQNEIEEELGQKRLAFPVIIPSCSQWFDMNAIHQLEKESFKEFFQTKSMYKSPEIYFKIRNYIIQLYRQNPTSYLTATNCRRNLAMDICSIIKLHSFLEHWGLINFNVKSELYDEKWATQIGSCGGERQIFRFNSKEDGTIDFLDQEKADYLSSKGKEYAKHSGPTEIIFDSVKMLSKQYRPICDFCGIKCGMLWYKQLPSISSSSTPMAFKIPDIILCISCYSNNKFPSILSQSDFSKEDLLSTLGIDELGEEIPVWTSQETLKLLELITLFQDNWDEVFIRMEQSGFKRTKEEILMHFLKLPMKNITEVQLESNVAQGSSDTYISSLDSKRHHYAPTLFQDAANPLFQHVAIFKYLLDQAKFIQTKKQSQMNQSSAQEEAQKCQTKISTTMIDEKSEQDNANNTKIEPSTIIQSIQAVATETDATTDTRNQKRTFSSLKQATFEHKIDSLLTLTEDDIANLSLMENRTTLQARKLKDKEQSKIVELVDQLVECQLSTIELKLQQLEEYEQIIWHEKMQMQSFQTSLLAERVELAFTKGTLQTAPEVWQRQQSYDNPLQSDYNENFNFYANTSTDKGTIKQSLSESANKDEILNLLNNNNNDNKQQLAQINQNENDEYGVTANSQNIQQKSAFTSQVQQDKLKLQEIMATQIDDNESSEGRGRAIEDGSVSESQSEGDEEGSDDEGGSSAASGQNNFQQQEQKQVKQNEASMSGDDIQHALSQRQQNDQDNLHK